MVWIGGLIVLIVHGLRRDNGFADAASLQRAARRFGLTAVIAVILLGVSGVANAYTRLDTPDQLFTTDYGRTVLAKIIVLSNQLFLSAPNQYVLRRRRVRCSVRRRRARAPRRCPDRLAPDPGGPPSALRFRRGRRRRGRADRNVGRPTRRRRGRPSRRSCLRATSRCRRGRGDRPTPRGSPDRRAHAACRPMSGGSGRPRGTAGRSVRSGSPAMSAASMTPSAPSHRTVSMSIAASLTPGSLADVGAADRLGGGRRWLLRDPGRRRSSRSRDPTAARRVARRGSDRSTSTLRAGPAVSPRFDGPT